MQSISKTTHLLTLKNFNTDKDDCFEHLSLVKLIACVICIQPPSPKQQIGEGRLRHKDDCHIFPVIVFFGSTKRYRERFRCGLFECFEAQHPKKYQTRFLIPKRYDEHPCPGVTPV